MSRTITVTLTDGQYRVILAALRHYNRHHRDKYRESAHTRTMALVIGMASTMLKKGWSDASPVIKKRVDTRG